MRPGVAVLAVFAAVAPVTALKIDIGHAEIERALTIARAPAADRARFHAPYLQVVDTPFVERAEVITELRRVVLLAEEQTARGDRFFAYSATRASQALEVFRRRVSVRAQVRFHPLNTYVSVPPVTMTLVGNERALIGVRLDPVYGAAVNPGDAAPILGAVVEASFEAAALGQARREFLVRLDGQELGRVSFDFGAID
jgi:hypothetical protein